MKPLLLVGTLLMAFSVNAFAQGSAVSNSSGPITALERLESLKALPAAKAKLHYRQLNTQSWTTKNGMRVLFVQATELPMLDIRLIFDAGAARDEQKSGLASMTSRMLEEGTKTRNTTDIAAAFEGLGAAFDNSSHRDMAVVQLRVLTDPQFLDPALNVFTDVIANAAFPEENYKRIFQSAQIGQQQRKQSPSAQASLIFYKNLYGEHPYSTPPAGLPETIKKISVEDLRAFHKRYYVARNANLALVGDVSVEQAKAISEAISNGLPVGEPAPELAKVEKLKKPRHVNLEFASEQTHVILGETGITRNEPDYYALYVGNEILGGSGFGSRLTEELREKRGLTYGVSSGFTPMRAHGPFSISFSTSAEQADNAIQLTRDVLKDFIKNGPTDQQVKDTIANLVESYPLDSASNSSIVGTLGMIGFYGLPVDYMDTFLSKVQAVTAKDVRAAFARHVNPDKQLLVTVGPKRAVK